MRDLVFYDAQNNVGEVYAMNMEGNITFLQQYANWLHWTHIIPGQFGGNAFTDLLCFDSHTGIGEFYRMNPNGEMTRLIRHTHWRSTWTHIIPGNFNSNTRFTDLLFYDATAGVGFFYSTDGRGGINVLQPHSGWRHSWTHIIPGQFGGDGFTDLLFYDATAGVGEFYATDGQGGIRFLRQHTGWRHSWTNIIQGRFSDGGFTDLLFYDANAGVGEFYATDGQGEMRFLKQHTDWRHSWASITPCRVTQDNYTDLLFYDNSEGSAEVYATDGQGGISLITQHTGWRHSWKKIIPGFFNALDTVNFNGEIVSGGLAALGGSVSVAIHNDGSVLWQGHAHDSGADGYHFRVSALVKPPYGHTIALVHSGYVAGTFTVGSRDHTWNEVAYNGNALIASFLDAYTEAQFEVITEYDSAIGSFFESILAGLLKFGTGSALGGLGNVIFVGIEIGSVISTGSLVPGARLAEGILWMAGPSNTLFAIGAEGIASAGSQTRMLSDEEYNFANNEVFLGTLPPRDKLVLTDTIGAEDRAFVFPRFDGKITINMGAEGFRNPLDYHTSDRGNVRGEVFIHELVHACQLHYSSTDLVILADALSSKICEATGGDAYTYGLAGFDYSTLNLEQQAQIVSDWFAGRSRDYPHATNHTGVPKDTNSPYFRYITGNVRAGRY